MKETRFSTEFIEISAEDITKRFKQILKGGFKKKHSILEVRNHSNIEIIVRYKINKEIIFFLTTDQHFIYEINFGSRISKRYFPVGTRVQIKRANNDDDLITTGKISICAFEIIE